MNKQLSGTSSFPDAMSNQILSWRRKDIEQTFGFSGGRFTRVNSIFTAIVALIMTVVFYLVMIPLDDTRFAAMFTQRGYTPYAIVYFSSWSLMILVIKWRKLAYQRKSLNVQIIPQDADFVLSVTTVDSVLEEISRRVDDPKHFVLFNRIVIALSNLRNLGRVSDVDEMLRSHAELDESSMDTSFSLLRGFVWAIPVLGFIGTVLGLSVAIGGFGDVLSSNSELSQVTASLKNVTGGLATAFETTLIALVCALAIQILVTFQSKNEQEFMDECTEYCQMNIVSKLRLMPFETNDQA